MPKHAAGPVCESCIQKLWSGHPDLFGVFSEIKESFPDCHVSWVFRGKEDQDKAFADGKSKLKWPESPHNRMKDGKPCAIAMDLFQLGTDGKAHFPIAYYASIWEKIKETHPFVFWGGNFKTLGDSNHFQLNADFEVHA